MYFYTGEQRQSGLRLPVVSGKFGGQLYGTVSAEG